MNCRSSLLCAAILSIAIALGASVEGQVGKSLGLVDANFAPEKDLLGMPHMSPAIVKGILERRPFGSIVDLNGFLLSQGLNQQQATEFYRSAFIHINLNTATREEIVLIPGAGNKMAHEFAEYRPWRNFVQFNKEIGKYVGPAETARLAQYGFIPINLNSASDEDIQSIPGVGPRMLREFKEYRPYRTIEQFRKEIGKYVNAKEVARLERYVTIQ
jgi:DNA uptake protein ComE-like DNA-binding protein